ncbi:unnamed protein product [Urochloa humidicola]
MVSRVAQSWEQNDAVVGMVSDLGTLLSSQGNKEREAWGKLHRILPEILCSLSVALNPNTTTDHILKELKKMSSLRNLGHLEAEQLFRKIIVAFEKRIREENPDASETISLFKNLVLLIASQLDMLPIRDSNHVSMISGYSFCQDEVDRMINASKELSDPNAPYAVISIVGAQSSGKSYLLNQLFGTDFPEMNPWTGWARTTRGIMISRCINPSLLILDVEGFDGVERQKLQDSSFENKAALFTLAISDLMMVNIIETDINREDGGGAKLFRAIFQERAELPQGSTQIIVVVRRCGGEIPMDILERQVKKRMEELWENVNNERENVLFKDYIEVKVIALPDKESDMFREKVKELRKILSNSTFELSAAKVPAASFSHSSNLLWEEIKQNRRLDIPSHKVVVATMFCNKIAEEARDSLYSHKEYDALKGERSPRGFKEKSDRLLDSIIATYDQETKMYDNIVREKERKRLLHEIKTALAVYAKKLITKKREDTSEQFQNDFAMILNNMEENVELSYYDSWIETCGKQFTDSCEDLKEFDTDFFHDKHKDLQSELHIYIRSKLLRLMEEHARKEIELARQGKDQNIHDLMKKLEETMADRQLMDEEMKRQKEKQEQESSKAIDELKREHQKEDAIKDKIIESLKRELQEKRARPTFSLTNMLKTLMDFFTA